MLGRSMSPARARHGGRLTDVWRYKEVYLIMLPALLWYLVFAYFPMGGLSLAFKTFRANLGILRSPWVGVQNFHYVFRDPAFFASLKTTFEINIARLVTQFPFPILLALALNELRMGRYKKALQTVYTFPNFLSWVIVSSIVINFLGIDGFVNNIVKTAGGESINFLGDAYKFRPLLYITEIWKSSGWGAIVYLAAISGIDTEQFEAAEIDGATRLQRIWHVTLPSITGTINVMLVLACGGLMTAGFDQIFNMSNAVVQSVSTTLDMYIYQITFQSAADFSFSTAVSLFKSIINLVLMVSANWAAKKFFGSGLFA